MTRRAPAWHKTCTIWRHPTERFYSAPELHAIGMPPRAGRKRAPYLPFIFLPHNPMSWHGQLTLRYRRDGERTIAHDLHHGPLRVLQRHYPEGPERCHHTLVHPPGGIVGGDELHIDAHLAEGSHALITTPGATRFYKSTGALAQQRLHARLDAGSRLEWLPLETLAYRGCVAHNHMRFDLMPGAEMIGWDVLALGLPAAGEHFDDPAWSHGRYTQEIDVPGVWLEKGTVRADDQRLLNSPLGWAGKRVMATLWLSTGSPMSPARREQILAWARDCHQAHALDAHCGASSPHEQLVVMRVLADRVEPAMQLLVQVWSAWREQAWQLPPTYPRIWRM